MRLEGKTAIITGAASGFGKETALRFAEEGASIAVVDLNIDGAREVAAEINAAGGRAIAIQTNVTEEAAIHDMVEQVKAEFGVIDILINNAGKSRSKPIEELSLREWDQAMNLNLKSVFLCTREVIPHMIERQYGKIVNLASICAQTARAVAVDYSASKSGIVGITRTVALQVAKHGINVNAVAPGPVETPLWQTFAPERKAALMNSVPFKRMGTPRDIANLLLFLASDEAGWITGECVAINGGTFIG